jgi:hypothetical protein
MYLIKALKLPEYQIGGYMYAAVLVLVLIQVMTLKTL